MGDNQQQQEDEILVLQSIFGDDFQENKSGFQFEVKLPINLPKAIQLLLPDSQKTPKMLPVSHLPPLQLQITFHKDYPSKYPPGFTLSSIWLARLQISKLCSKLDQIWLQAPGEVVVYNWAEFLREQSAEYLEIIKDNSITLASNARSDEEIDSRALSFYRPKIALHVLRHIFDYNRELTRREFVLSEQTCRICYTESSGKDFLHLACGDSYCSDCLTQFVSTFVSEGSVESLVCPNPECRSPLLPTDIRNCTTDELYERFERLTLQRGLEKIGDAILGCPRCKSAVVTDSAIYGKNEKEDFCSFAMCSDCVFAFCSKCYKPWKENSPCKQLSSAKQIDIASVLSKPAESWTKDEAGTVDEYMSVVSLSKISRRCPNCATRISKSSGCNKMTCSRCSHYFCWLCGIAIKGYDHFSENKRGCRLFEDEELGQGFAHDIVDNYNIKMEDVLKQGDFQTNKCPKCDNLNFKDSPSNLIICWSCAFPFCFLCKEACFGPYHFSEYGCPARSNNNGT